MVNFILFSKTLGFYYSGVLFIFILIYKTTICFMVYVSDNTAQLITINGTTDTQFVFVNNQTLQRYELNLWIVGMFPTTRKQISFMLQWNNVAESSTPAVVVDGINVLNVPAGEYNYSVGNVKGIMILKAAQETKTTYENEQKNIVYNG